ncbi:hypothetical protein CsSME_00046154 [Camellia sinensis var. sinensis]
MQLYAVQFHLFVTCVFFLSREGFWRACMRADIKCDGASTGENASKILKVAWMTVPFGIVITVAACVFWWQELSYSNPYAQAILINGNQHVYISSVGHGDMTRWDTRVQNQSSELCPKSQNQKRRRIGSYVSGSSVGHAREEAGSPVR